MSRRSIRLSAGAVALLLACQDASTPTGPDLHPASAGAVEARGGNAAPLTATPTSLGFLLPVVTPATVTARVQYVGTITAASSNTGCATVSPQSVPATKPPGSSMYVATFAVTPVGAGACSITLTDKQGKRAQVGVHVEAALTERMVYSSGGLSSYDIFVREPDGSVTQLTHDFRGDAPAVTPDGRIVFSANVSSPDHNGEIYIMGPDGSNPTRLTLDEPHGPRDDDPAVSPSGQQVAFSRDVVGSATSDIHVMGIDGSSPVPLTGGDGLYSEPSYSADGARIVFSGYREENFDIYVMDADGSDQVRLTTSPGLDHSPVFAPDGGIVFVSDRDGNSELYRMDPDGSNQTRLTTDAAGDYAPTFTGDGRLVFVSNRDGDLEIYLRGTNGVLHALTANDEPDAAPAF